MELLKAAWCIGVDRVLLVAGVDLNLRPSGYEPDELQAAPSRDNSDCVSAPTKLCNPLGENFVTIFLK